MDIPVLIPARNEEARIGRTLDSLASQKGRIEPMVIVNGSTDKTADVARERGVYVTESEEGKMPALQRGLRALGKNALSTVLILDADSRPVSKNWSIKMHTETYLITLDRPGITWGPYVFKDEINSITGAFFSLMSLQVSWADRHKEHPRTIRGGNTAIRIQKEDLLEEVLSLPNYWPREDVAVFDTFMNNGASAKVNFHPEAWAITSGRRLSANVKTMIKERRGAEEVYDESYEKEAPPGSKPYNSPYTDN